MPTYIYDTGIARQRAVQLKAALPGITVLYAVKANGHPAVVSAFAQACDGLEVASGGELTLAVDAGAQRIVFGGPAKTDAELTHALQMDVTINVESAHELRRLALLADQLGIRAEVLLRVNRKHADLPGTHAMTGVPTPFGIEEQSLPSVVGLAQDLGVCVKGWHLHAVSNNLDARAHTQFAAESLDWSVNTALALGIDLRCVNLGGGFGVSYTDDAEFDLSALSITAPPGIEVIVEPGRWLAAEIGQYTAEVIDLKHTHGRWFAVLRGGTHHFRLPAAWGYSHPFTVQPVDNWDYPWPRPYVEEVTVDAVGELCTPRDVLTRDSHVSLLRVGDLLVFSKTGAYGWDISHHDFLRHPKPDFVIR